MSEHTYLDRRLPVPGWFGLSATLLVLIAAFVRLFRLDTYLLNVREASWAYDAWSMYQGRPLPAGEYLPESGPFMILWHAVSFFLFGVTDATARVGSAVLGIGLVALVLLLRPFLTRLQILTIVGLLTLSPTFVFASRITEPGIAAAFFALLVLVALLRAGFAPQGSHLWPVVLGFALASLYATGPLGVTTMIALGLGIGAAGYHDLAHGQRAGAIGGGLRRISSDRGSAMWMMVGLVFALVFSFSRAFTSLSSLTGIATTLADWSDMMFTGVSTVPAMFTFWSLMLYETFSVVIAVLTAIFLPRVDRDQPISLTPLLFVVWSIAALLLHTVASSRDAGSTVLVALPMILLAGMGLGRALEGVRTISPQSVGVGLVSLIIIVYSVNAMVGLAFTRGESGAEPLAHDVPAAEMRDFLDQVMRLSRDLSVDQADRHDPTGRFGLRIQVTPEYEWPFAWYFREFPEFSVSQPGAFTAETDVAIAANAEVIDTVGLTSSSVVWINKPGDPLTMMRSGDILRTGLMPSKWGNAWSYMIHRETARSENPRTITIGYSVRVMNKLNVATGPFNLFDGSSPGAGTGLGQLDLPTGIAVGADDTIYVLNAGNARIDRYSHSGEFLGIWNGQVDAPLQLSWNGMQGGTGLQIGPDGLVYIADTWNHAVVVVSPNGTVVRVLGNRGTQTDISDWGLPESKPGLFFGPRDVAVTQDRIYVTDTGNERVQIFAMDGTFVSAFGGFGAEDGQFVEPTGIAVAPDGRVWVADSGNARLQVFDADGTWLESYAVPEWKGQLGTARLNMLAFDANGVLYFTTPAVGTRAWYEGESVLIPGTEVIRPGGITIDADGDLLITDMDGARVIRLTPELPESFGAPMATPQATPAD